MNTDLRGYSSGGYKSFKFYFLSTKVYQHTNGTSCSFQFVEELCFLLL